MNTIITFKTRTEARNAAKELGGKLVDRKDLVQAGEDRWAVEYQVEAKAEAVLAAAPAAEVVNVPVQAVQPEEVKGIPSREVIRLGGTKKQVKRPTFLHQKSGKQIPVHFKRQTQQYLQ